MLLPSPETFLAQRAHATASTLGATADLERSARAFWPYISNHHLSAKVLGKPAATFARLPAEQGLNQLVRFSYRTGGLLTEGIELPYEWSTYLFFRGEVVGVAGPFAYMRLGVEAEDREPGKARLRFTMAYTSAWPGFVCKTIGKTLSKMFTAGYVRLDAAAPPGDSFAIAPYYETGDDVDRRARDLASAWKALHAEGDLTEKLARYVIAAPNRNVRRMRPFEVADLLGLPRLDVLRFMLRATKEGHLEMSWDIMCPSCRGSSAESPHLQDVVGDAHCASCNIQYSAEFDRHVEATFHPAARVRVTEETDYCLQTQGNTPHVWAQLNVAPGETRAIPLSLDPGSYRLHSLTLRGEIRVQHDGDGAETLAIVLEGNELPKLPVQNLAARATLSIENRTDRWRTLRLDSERHDETAATAFQVTTLQDFRDMFGAEALRPGVRLGVTSVALLFSDLKDSTALYERRGDATAFSLVQRHFDIMFDVIRRHEGGVVKTIGDAVMAAFTREEDALRAAAEILDAFDAWNGAHEADDQIVVKMGLHAGPCIALNLNDRLDYFGSNVNKAARVQGTARGCELVVSDRVLATLGEDRVKEIMSGGAIDRFDMELKGIAGRASLARLSRARLRLQDT